MCPPCRAPEQLHGSHPAVTRPGLHEWPCWQWVGYDHQSGSGSSSIYLLERPQLRKAVGGYRAVSMAVACQGKLPGQAAH